MFAVRLKPTVVVILVMLIVGVVGKANGSGPSETSGPSRKMEDEMDVLAIKSQW